MRTLVSLVALLGVVSVTNADVYIYMQGHSEVVMREPPAEMGALEVEPSATGTGLRPSEIRTLEMLTRARERREAAREQRPALAEPVSERRRICRDLHRIMNDPQGMSRTINSRQALYEYNKRGCRVDTSSLSYELNPVRR
ncbi:MAG: hypothetical protein GWN84_10280 [Gammaproteobacteria bacterium]|nr:hypothetical protein [Gammaproteobacteria bacterium]NIR83253.1 hypothetical protein [Gammaproteobacteria bacterium]NIR91057.1 hypothetical protein [Gammaproteobacteria bacterium]NIU04418.1 hypothetical protein [Gammaproteobacteria bacterium]NIV76373.1 hypothetical protein [Gammaproteobacteria bacterium]